RSLPDDLESKLLACLEPEKVATRKASGTVLQTAAELVPWLVGGSADLAPSTNTLLKAESSVAAGRFNGRNLHFGVREHAMGAVLNGMSLYGGWIPYGATFLVFSDYMRPAVRLAAMMRRQTIYVFSHDSILIGEDGPTHQPIEHLAGLRAIPNLVVIRPADGPETAIAWATALRRKDGPTALILTRQSLPPIERPPAADASGLKQGGYLLLDCDGSPDVLLIGGGSELHLLVDVWKRLGDAGRAARVISMPSLELFGMQPQSYRETVLPPTCRRRVVVEAANAECWRAVAEADGVIIGIDRFGASAPYAVLAERFGFTADAIYARVAEYLSDQRGD
ncbi:transketolase, partial [candidate division KD3-62 bacterium DG_56]